MLVDHALQYAGRGWRIFPVHTTVSGSCSCGRDCGKDAGKHPRIKSWQKTATTDPAQIERWWAKWPDANIGVATGSGLIVLDLDGPDEITRFTAIAERHGGLPPTLVCQTGRGLHLYLSGQLSGSHKVSGLLVRGEGGYVIAPPSWHASTSKEYQWVNGELCAKAPDWFMNWAQTIDNTRKTLLSPDLMLGPLPGYVKPQNNQSNQSGVVKRARSGLEAIPQTRAEIARLTSALATIPANCARDPWLHVGMALHALQWERPDGTDLGFELWRAWSETGDDKFQGLHDLETRWRSFGRRGGVGLGTLYHLAEQHGWQGLAPRAAPNPDAPLAAQAPPAAQHPFFDKPPVDLKVNGHGAEHVLPEAFTSVNDSPLIGLNNQYAAIGDIGGKCLVLGWVPSKVDSATQVPSFQTFKSFAERYANQYVVITKKKRDGTEVEEPAQLGASWLKWRRRRSFEGIDLVPGLPAQLPGNVLNLWRGFAVRPQPGKWDRMKQHVAEVLADNDAESLDYIMRWSAWAVQNPGERAEVALVFRGEKGSGKGTFGNALRRIFGQHGLQIFNSKHLVGNFNSHLANCLFLFADEAFWAGDRQGESTLKGLITEQVAMIEKKGVDAIQWKNRIHLVMAANAEWVVPASHDERRYAVFNVSSKHLRNESYFNALYAEMNAGGHAAMLHDLLAVDLKDWHPRKIPNTKALREQKIRSMGALQEWWADILENGYVPGANKDAHDAAMAHFLIQHARDFAPRLKELTTAAFGRFLADQGCIKLHRSAGNAWRFPLLPLARAKWAQRYQGWDFAREADRWAPKT